MLNIVIPMAGKGSRFYDLGYTCPKPLIKIADKPFFYYAASSLTRFVSYEKLIFVALKEHNPNNELVDAIKSFFPDAEIKLLDETPPGAVLTAKEGVDLIDNDFPIICNDCDHLFYSQELYQGQDLFSELDGFLMTFFADSPAYSYIKKDQTGQITGTVEKKVVSNEAIGGVYGFRNKQTFLSACEEYLKTCTYKEFFISGLYNTPTINNIKAFVADFNISFGTVDEFQKVKDNQIFTMWNK
ncbi:MAG: sugar phosphate nucleotidyltransferase [Brevinema sp.]